MFPWPARWEVPCRSAPGAVNNWHAYGSMTRPASLKGRAMNKLLAAASFAVTFGMYAGTGAIDMNDPRRALGREDDVRIDAQLVNDTVAAGAPIGVTWQIQNFTDAPIAVAPRVVDVSYDAESATITVAIGSEVPDGGKMPLMSVVAPGQKRVFRSSAMLTAHGGVRATAAGAPGLVQVKVSILRDLEPFVALIRNQTPASAPEKLSDELFEQWFESTDTILLNTLPVQWSARIQKGIESARRRGGF